MQTEIKQARQLVAGDKLELNKQVLIVASAEYADAPIYGGSKLAIAIRIKAQDGEIIEMHPDRLVRISSR